MDVTTPTPPTAPPVDPLNLPLASEVNCLWDERWSGTLTYRPDGTVTLIDKLDRVLFSAPVADLAPVTKMDTTIAFSIQGREIPFTFGDPKAYRRAIRWDFSGPTNVGYTHHRAKTAWNARYGMDDWAALFAKVGILDINVLPRDPWTSGVKTLAIVLAAWISVTSLFALIVGFGMNAITK